jgi:hypothetical protein
LRWRASQYAGADREETVGAIADMVNAQDLRFARVKTAQKATTSWSH